MGATVKGCGRPRAGSPKTTTWRARVTAGSTAASGVDSPSRTTTASISRSSGSAAESTSGLAVHTGASARVRSPQALSSCGSGALPWRSMSRSSPAASGCSRSRRRQRWAWAQIRRCGPEEMCAESARRKSCSARRRLEPSVMGSRPSSAAMASSEDCHQARSNSSATRCPGTRREVRSSTNSPRPRSRRPSSSSVRSGMVSRLASSSISWVSTSRSSATSSSIRPPPVREPSRAIIRPSRSSMKRCWISATSSTASEISGFSIVVDQERQRSRSDWTLTREACRSERWTPGRMYSLAALRSRERCSPDISIA